MSKTITEKKYYKVGKTFSYTDKDFNGLLNIPFGIWVTTHSFEVISSMKWEKAYKLCTQITGKIIDDSVKTTAFLSIWMKLIITIRVVNLLKLHGMNLWKSVIL